jgi:hypothetical protein
LTSPFFAGREDIVLASQSILDDLSDADGGPAGLQALAAIRDAIAKAANEQALAASRQ